MSSVRRSSQRRQRGGFTLVELMVSLVMSLIVSLAAVALAGSATSTFYEQARMSSVEASVRSATERLRNDLSRVSYMSTPNIQWDNKVAAVPGGSGAPYRIPALADLQGIRIGAAGAAVRGHPLQQKASLTPQEVYIAGNLTTDDLYRGQLVAVGGSGCGDTVIRLSPDADPGVRRLLSGATTANERIAMAEVAFMPGSRMSPPEPSADYAVQVTDMRGCFHYLTVCGFSDASIQQTNAIDVRLKGGVLTTSDTQGDICGARLMEEVSLAPIQRVKWSLAVETDARRIDPTLEGTGGDKFNLTRQLLAADGATPIGPAEVVAEYGVDLKFGLIVDSSTSGNPVTFTNLDFESNDASFTEWAGPATSSTRAKGPHHIRSVRYRLAFRVPFADRTANLAMPSGPPYISRYCMLNADPCTSYARVRTIISEVALLNQAKAYFDQN